MATIVPEPSEPADSAAGTGDDGRILFDKGGASGQSLQVAVRVRPLSDKEINKDKDVECVTGA